MSTSNAASGFSVDSRIRNVSACNFDVASPWYSGTTAMSQKSSPLPSSSRTQQVYHRWVNAIATLPVEKAFVWAERVAVDL